MGRGSTVVQATRELARILAIPRRVNSQRVIDSAVEIMTLALRQPNGQQTLRPTQALALYELAITEGGQFNCMAAGEGKTIVSLLGPVVREAKRPMLLLPASLIEKTEHEMVELSQHWQIPGHLYLRSYQSLGLEDNVAELTIRRPDYIGADEGHRLKNKDGAAVAMRVDRYMMANPITTFHVLSATMWKDSLKNFAHILRWAMPPLSCPVPARWSELETWSGALDDKADNRNPVSPGALLQLCNTDELQHSPRKAARLGFQRRMRETLGIILGRSDWSGCPLVLRGVSTAQSPAVGRALLQLRKEWETPDGWTFDSPLDLRRHAFELAQGYYNVWDPRPPPEWVKARREWHKGVRYVIKTNRRDIDTPKALVTSILAGHEADTYVTIDDEPRALTELYAAWKRVEPVYKIRVRPVWICDRVVQYAARWLDEHQGIVWVGNTAVGRRLSDYSGSPYYAEGGLDSEGRSILHHAPGTGMIASISANREGKNLQAWARNLVLKPPTKWDDWEQLLARTHRPGQNAQEVSAEVLITCLEHDKALSRAMQNAQAQHELMQQEPRLLLAACEWRAGQYDTDGSDPRFEEPDDSDDDYTTEEYSDDEEG